MSKWPKKKNISEQEEHQTLIMGNKTTTTSHSDNNIFPFDNNPTPNPTLNPAPNTNDKETLYCNDSVLETNQTRKYVASENNKTIKESGLDEDITTVRSPDPVAAARRYAAGFPIKGWERYEYLSYIGEGGMGRVFKARDPRLNRTVALKFIRGDDNEMVRRFSLEAQAQARILHENICRVYEVGEEQGYPYIAMQFINGPSLKEAITKLSLEQKVRVIKEVAEALHVTHREGVIHRDIKPVNIMLEQKEDNHWHPYVMDFGLARDVEREGQTMTGTIMGTPAYMPPEQAKGETSRMDRRSDIYSLGASFYELLTGELPFVGTNSFEVMLKVLREEPATLRSIDATIPADLETITLKCLEKDPQRRYQSAKALAEDLQRYLEGDPIQARRTTLSYRLMKKARKHRALVTVSTIALIAIMVLTGMWLQSRFRLVREAETAQRLGQEVKEIEAIARYSRMLPRHNTDPEVAAIMARITKIQQELAQAGSLGRGPANYAIGSGYLALHQNENARLYLERAWDSDYRTADVGFALGLVWGEFYKNELELARRDTNSESREARIRKIEVDYRDKALKYLRSSVGENLAARNFAEGLIAFYEQHFDEALAKADQAFTKEAWRYEARELRGDIYYEIANQKNSSGAFEEANKFYEMAGNEYTAAIDAARSDARLYLKDARRYCSWLKQDYEMGVSAQEHCDLGITAIDAALLIDPKYAEAYAAKCQLYFRLGQYQATRGIDPSEAFAKAVEMGQQGISYNPQNMESYVYMGLAEMHLGRYAITLGQSPIAMWQRAIDIYKKALLINSNSDLNYENLGNTYWSLGFYQLRHGIDPTAALNAAIENQEKALHLNPQRAYSYNLLGNAYVIKGEYETDHGIDPLPSLAKAKENYQAALKINAKFYMALSNIGLLNRAKTRYEIYQGIDPLPSFNEGLASAEAGVKINSSAEINRYYGELLMRKANYLLEQGLDAAPFIEKSAIALADSTKLNGKDYETFLRKAELALVSARWAIKHNRDAKDHFADGFNAINAALASNKDSADVYQAAAALYYYQAEWLKDDKKSFRNELKNGLEMIDQAININGQLATAFLLKARLMLLQTDIAGEDRSTLNSNAKQLLSIAVKINPFLKHRVDQVIQIK